VTNHAHNGQNHFDVLVVGSGFGGSVAALRLTEKGYRVGVLEAGRRWADSDFTTGTWNIGKYVWAPGLGLKGIQRIHALPNVILLAGAGVGGGSLVYSNVLYEPRSAAFYSDKGARHPVHHDVPRAGVRTRFVRRLRSRRNAQELLSNPRHVRAVEDRCDAFQVVQLDFRVAAQRT
jgi:choline dehydrogenase-like flavoprotein